MTGKAISTQAELIAALTEAAALEHQFMCQYLYAALSLKKSPDAACTDAQFEHVRRWGFHPPGGDCSAIVPPGLPDTGAVLDVEVGTIQHLYMQIAIAIRVLEASLGEKTLFSGHDSGQAEVVSEYQVFLFPITSANSAVAALQMVMQQGEGLNAPPGFDSHFLNYHEIAADYGALLDAAPGFQPFKPLPLDPTLAGFTDPNARAAAQLFNDGYVTLLYMLTGYYGLFDPARFNKPGSYLTAALEYNAFSPMMTMFVRTLGEILTELPAMAPDDGCRAAPVFDIPPADLAQLAITPAPGNFYAQAPFYAARLARLVTGIEALAKSPGLPPSAASRLDFMHQNISRLAANFGSIDVAGIYGPWAPSTAEAS